MRERHATLLLSIRDDIAWFDKQCSDAEHTDTDTVWRLMNDWRERIEKTFDITTPPKAIR